MRGGVTSRQIAAAFGVTLDWLYRHRRRLETEHGFPRPMPGFAEPRWDPRAIALWQDGDLRRQGLLPALAAADTAQLSLNVTGDATPPDLDEILERRGAAIARGAQDAA